jgi:RNA polymerase sigma-70 factor (ECF subfamily)
MTTPQANDFESTALPHLNELYRSARHTLGNQAAAEDVIQETYLQAWKSFHRFEPGTNIRAWLHKIMFHVINHYWYKNNRLVTVAEEEEFIFDQLVYEPPVPEELQDEEMLAALGRLPENYRAAILLADVQEFAYLEIAEIMKIPIGTVMSRLSRGRKLLRKELSADLTANAAAVAARPSTVNAASAGRLC